MDLQPGTSLWVEAPGSKYLKSGVLISVNGDSAIIKLDKEQMTVPLDKINPMHQNCVDGVDDMISLTDLHEGSLIYNLKTRFRKQLIYTYVGSILIAVNPYKVLPLYEPSLVKEYRHKAIGEMPPHVFSIADNVFNSMLKESVNQCVIISGESGAGKTETTKVILQYLAMLSGKHSQIEERILASSPILESFGNACTVRNNNSSRFGKFIEIQFTQHGVIEGGKINEYLLEKSRIVMQAAKERNYHSFYCLLAGLDARQKSEWRLGKPDDYYYLNRGEMTKIDSINDKEDFERLIGAFDNLDFSQEYQQKIFKTLAIIIHLGNVSFKKNDNGEDTAQVSNNEALENTAFLMSLSIESLARALLNRISVTRQETFVTPLNVTQASDARDALAKALYGSLFTWLVGKVNEKIQVSKSKQSIGVLDIFGFEDFEKNSFEQLCINYANEKLQQFFNHHIFKMEQDEYKKEGISWSDVSYVDNQPCLDLISKKPMGIFQLLDEESSLPKSTDKSFVEKVRKNHEQNAYFSKSKTSDITFSVNHYAGKVTYNTEGFLDKNRDLLRADLEKTCMESEFDFLSEILIASNQDDVAKKAMTLKNPSKANAGPAKKTAGSKFDDSLAALIAILSSCHPHFVRCIKPNVFKKPDIFDEEMVLQQLRYSGLLETVKIRQSGYPVRKVFNDFYQRYQQLIAAAGCAKNADLSNAKAVCELYLRVSLPEFKGQWQMGSNRIFYKEALDTFLEKHRNSSRGKRVLVIQRYYRGCRQRKKYLSMKKAAVFIQSFYRYRQKKLASKRRTQASLVIQKYYKAYRARNTLLNLKQAAIILVAGIKMKLAKAQISYLYQSKLQREAEKIKQQQQELTKAPQQEQLQVHVEEAVVREESVKETLSPTSQIIPLYHPEVEEWLHSVIQKCENEVLISKFQDFLASKSLDTLGEPIDPFRTHEDYENFEELAAFEFKKYVKTFYAHADDSFVLIAPSSPLLTSIPHDLYQIVLACYQSIIILMNNLCIEDDPLSPLDRFRFVISACVNHPQLSDEIFCIFLKQLNGNPRQESLIKGWRLLAIFMYFVAPSSQLSKYLYSQFGEVAPKRLIPLLETRLLRSLDSGSRRLTPTFEEISSIENSCLMAKVFLEDRELGVMCDSMTTLQEILHLAMARINITSFAGWAVQLNTLNDSWLSFPLSSHLFDLVPTVVADLFSGDSKAFPIALMISKEFMGMDEVLRDENIIALAYEQAVKSLKYLPAMAVDVELLANLMVIQARLSKVEANESLLTEIYPNTQTKFAEVEPIIKKSQIEDSQQLQLKKKFCGFAADVPMIFCKRFSAQVKEAPFPVSQDPIQIYLDRNGIFFCNSSVLLLHTSFIDLMENILNDSRSIVLNTVNSTIRIELNQAADFSESIKEISSHLQNSSKWALVKMDNRAATGDQTVLPCLKGDILEILETRDESKDWIRAKNLSLTDRPTGLVSVQLLKLLPSRPKIIQQRQPVQEPAPSTMTLDQPLPIPSRPLSISSTLSSNLEEPFVSQTPPNEPEHVLDGSFIEWALNNFRLEKKKIAGGFKGTLRIFGGSDGIKDSVDNDISRIREKMVFTKAPMQHSILKLPADQERIALELFQLLMKFMGDYPCAKDQTAVDCCRLILIRSLENPGVRNELYCQIIRQISNNPNPEKSCLRGWSLFEMVSNYVPPTPDLLSVIIKWLPLKGDKKSTAAIEKNLGIVGRFGPRKAIPTVEEVTFQQLNRQISIQVYLMDMSYKKLPVTPCSLVSDILKQICLKIDILDQWKHYELFYLKGREYHLLFPDEYILDGAYGQYTSTSPAFQPRKIFLRRVTIPKNYLPQIPAEISMIYCQLLELYRSGVTRATLAECAVIASLQIRASNTDSSRKDKSEKDALYRELIPPSVYPSIKPDVWAREIDAQLERTQNLSSADAKITLLKESTNWALAGSMVYAMSDPKCDKISMPNEVNFVVSQSGIYVLHGSNKSQLAFWTFDELAGYSNAPDKFNLKLGGMLSRNQIMFKGDTLQSREICTMIDRFSRKKDISIHPDLGRVLVALRDYNAGDVIFTEPTPLHSLNPIGLEYGSFHDPPLNTYIPTDWCRLLYVWIRLLNDKSEYAHRLLDKLSVDGVTSPIARSQDPNRIDEYKLGVREFRDKLKRKLLKKKIKMTLPDVETLERILFIIETNCHSTPTASAEEEHVGVWYFASMLEHSCIPNATVHIDENATISVCATRDISNGDRISITYQDQEFSTTQERQAAISRRGFQCSCPLCTGEVLDYANCILDIDGKIRFNCNDLQIDQACVHDLVVDLLKQVDIIMKSDEFVRLSGIEFIQRVYKNLHLNNNRAFIVHGSLYKAMRESLYNYNDLILRDIFSNFHNAFIACFWLFCVAKSLLHAAGIEHSLDLLHHKQSLDDLSEFEIIKSEYPQRNLDFIKEEIK